MPSATLSPPTSGQKVGRRALKVAGGAAKAVSGLDKLAKMVSSLQAAGIALAPVMPWMPLVSGALDILSAALSFYDLHKINKMRIALDELLRRGDLSRDGTFEAVAYTLDRFNTRERRSATGSVFLLGSVINLGEKFYRWQKKKRDGTLHQEREHHADRLWTNARRGDKVAVAACKILVTEPVWNEWSAPDRPEKAGVILVYAAINGWAP